MSRKENFLSINVEIYRLHVVVTWETKAEQIAIYAKKHGITVAKRFIDDFEENSREALGLCMKFENDNPDLIVWMERRPKKASEYATLYHELYHAVDSISESRNLDKEEEARAYVFEYLVTQANKFFWPLK